MSAGIDAFEDILPKLHLDNKLEIDKRQLTIEHVHELLPSIRSLHKRNE